MLSPTTTHHQSRAESLVLLTHSVGQTSVSATQWPESNKITFQPPFRIISFMILNTDMKYDLSTDEIFYSINKTYEVVDNKIPVVI